MRLLVTRAEGDARRTAARLAARGHEAVVAPVTAIEPTAEPLPGGSWDALLLTSAHAAPALARLELDGRSVFAVGPRTAAAARERGVVDLHEAEGDATALADLVSRTLPPGRALLHAAGRQRKAEPAASLRNAGFRVCVWEVYEAVAARQLPEAAREALQAGRLECALHYSRRSVEIVLALAEEAGVLAPFLALPQLCLSADVAQPLQAFRAARILVGARPSEQALLTTIDAVCDRDRPA